MSFIHGHPISFKLPLLPMRIHYKSCLLCFGIQNIIFPKTPCSYSIDMQPTFHKLDVAM